jgi:hypothetical protein
MIYDRVDRLGAIWRAGGWLYRGLGRLDACFGAARWEEALSWLATVHADRAISEIQLWMHGHWGRALIDGAPMDATALDARHPLSPYLEAIRPRLAPQALWWFRTCETFGKAEGHAFARAWSRFFDCRVAGHTHTIGVLQSGLHVLSPGDDPDWPLDEGVDPRDARGRGRASSWRAPHTITFVTGRVWRRR